MRMEDKFKPFSGKITLISCPQELKSNVFFHIPDYDMISTLENVSRECAKLTKDSIQIKKFIVGHNEYQILNVSFEFCITVQKYIFMCNFTYM